MSERFTSYRKAEQYLDSLINYERLLGAGLKYDTRTFEVDRFRELLRKLGNPQDEYFVIHVAGTKGKGSTCALIASILTELGYKVGLYTSPHIESYRERIRVNGKEIGAVEFAKLMGSVVSKFSSKKSKAEEPVGFRTVFEILTAMALVHFARKKVHFAVVETGLGGRLDSTNVFTASPEHPLVCVITPIAFDHVNILGPTIRDIAREKAAIIQTGAHFVLAAQPTEWKDEVERVVMHRAQYVQAGGFFPAEEMMDIEERYYGITRDTHGRPLQSLCLNFKEFRGRAAAPLAFDYTSLGFDIPLLGAHQAENLRTACAVMKAVEYAMLVAKGFVTFSCDRDSLGRGVANVRLPGRFDIQAMHPQVIVDGSHCPLSAKALADTFAEVFPDKEAVLVMGFMRDKQAAEICRAMSGLKIAAAICCRPDSPRAMSAEDTAAAARAQWPAVPIHAEPEPDGAIRQAIDAAGAERAVIIFGSMYLVGPARAALKQLRAKGTVRL